MQFTTQNVYLDREVPEELSYYGTPVLPDPQLIGINTSYGDSQLTPLITDNQSWWDNVTDLGSDFLDSAGNVVEKGYEGVSGALGRVRRDLSEGLAETISEVSAPVKDVAGFAIFQVVLVIGVLGVALYYTGKSGGLRVSV